jgi:hypothetical protein
MSIFTTKMTAFENDSRITLFFKKQNPMNQNRHFREKKK